jgi:hypothetical protein
VKEHSKLGIATRQLESAVMLFISGCDRVSAITLAGAADVILSQLLHSARKENFSDILMRQEAEETGTLPKRADHGRAVNDMLMINALKHMDAGDDDYIEMDVKVSALATVAKAVANYVALCDDSASFVQAFKLWAQMFVPNGVDQDGNARQSTRGSD